MRCTATLLGAATLALLGCGSRQPSTAGERLQREDLILVSRALQGLQQQVALEVSASKAAWPLVADGVPAGTGSMAHARLRSAAVAAAALREPALFGETQSAALTGPAAALAGLFRSYVGLAIHGWQLIGSSIAQIEHGGPAAARFARANVALYIESVYDGHFSLAQIGKQLRSGYSKLGGPAAFGAALSDAEVSALAEAYSEARDRLHPHAGVRLGS